MQDLQDHAAAYWPDTAPQTEFPRLTENVHVDVAIVGGGIVGLSAAALLQSSGRTIAVIEARRVGRQVSGHSTAKLTSQHGLIYGRLTEQFGKDSARTYADVNQAAIDQVATLVADLGLDCDFERRPAYLYTCDPQNIDRLRSEADAAGNLGLPAELVEDELPGLPFGVAAALRFTNQAQFHPVKYLSGLARELAARGVQIYEQTRATNIQDGSPCRVAAGDATVTARDVVVATHLPVMGDGKFFAKAYPYAIPMLAAPISPARAPDAMFLGIDTPSLSFIAAGGDDARHIVAAGDSFKPGHAAQATARMEDLERSVQEHFGAAEITHRWTNQDYMSMDGVPFVGNASGASKHLYVATGFGAWGLSNGTAAAMMIAGSITGRPAATHRLFDATRLRPVASVGNFVKENAEVASHFVRGYTKRRPHDPASLAPGEADVFTLASRRVAAHRDAGGALHLVSAVCTHLKCVLAWNPIERTWDCHCHGSRFSPEGDVVHGPAVSPLAAISENEVAQR